MSIGPDLNELVLGSEGTLGIITEAVVRLRPVPKVREFGEQASRCAARLRSAAACDAASV